MSCTNENESTCSKLRQIRNIPEHNPKHSAEVKAKLGESLDALIASLKSSKEQLRARFKVGDLTTNVVIQRETEKLELLEEACSNGPMPAVFLDQRRLLNYWYCGTFRNTENGWVYHGCGESLCHSCTAGRRRASRRSMVNRVLSYGHGAVLSVTLAAPVTKDAIAGWRTLKNAMHRLSYQIRLERLKKKPGIMASVIGYMFHWDLSKAEDGYRNHVHGLMTIKNGTEPTAILYWLENQWPKLLQTQGVNNA